jgi:putative endonuclease
MFYVYMLECADHTIYTGYTVNLEKRLIAHNQGTASKYTRARLPVTLVYSEAYSSKSEAMRREAALKRLSRADKLALINGS